jgi:hypothetical protein
LKYIYVENDANVITFFSGWSTLNLLGDGIDRFNFNKQCVQLHKMQVKNVSFIVGDLIYIKLRKPIPNANYGPRCDLTYAM